MVSIDEIGIGVLSSSKSRRMNINKANLKIGNETFLNHICKKFESFSEITIATNDRSITANAVYDEHEGVGPMEGIYQILKSTNKKYCFICSVDMPFINQDLVYYLVEKIDNEHECYIFKDEERVHPTCGIYSKNIVPVLKDLIDNKKYCLLEIYERCKTKYIDYNLDKKMLININTNEDYEKLCN
ncbi:MAG: molybdenum cofactor guanylyltransferase [Coriobacteriia bacterium]|nr:molybdenum cofactor guanylyltransferase [Coriobacteriia bacterium]